MLAATDFWDVVFNLGAPTAAAVIIICVVLYFWSKRTGLPVTNDASSDVERKAEERGEIRIRLENLESMKDLMDKNQQLLLEFARDNKRLTELFLNEVYTLRARVDRLEEK